MLGQPVRMLGRQDGLVQVVEDGRGRDDGLRLKSPIPELCQLVIDRAPRLLANSLGILVGVRVVWVDEGGDLRLYRSVPPIYVRVRPGCGT